MGVNEADRGFLEQALSLAGRARGRTSPNPLVGAVLVGEGGVVARGFHKGPGLDHAEIVALKSAASAGVSTEGTTVYVTLEPCCHHGRTPPCTQALIAAGVRRVVIGAIDPSPKVNGKGVEELRSAGIHVDLADDDIAHAARRQNDPFRKHARTGSPFITYKYAMTMDGRVATESGHSSWISGEESRRLVHRLRAWSDAVMVGAGTLERDDPLLTARDVDAHRQPLRVVADGRLSIRARSSLAASLEEGRVLVFCDEDVDSVRRAEVEGWGFEVVPVQSSADGLLKWPLMAKELGVRGVQSLLLEGGPRLAASAFESGLIDKVMCFLAPVIAGGAEAPGPLPIKAYGRMDEAPRLWEVTMERCGDDALLSGFLTEAY